jgi:RNA polymerase sigma factor (TIGR02999 family)
MSQDHPSSEIVVLLEALSKGDRSAFDKLTPLVYDEFHTIASKLLNKERPHHTFQPSDLVNEAFIKLLDQKRVNWQGRTHFLAVGAKVMRRILVDHARSKLRLKRGQRPHRVEWRDHFALSTDRMEDVLALDEALVALAERDARQARIVELRFFGGLSIQETAEVLGVSGRTVEDEWTMIRAWLRRQLSAPP